MIVVNGKVYETAELGLLLDGVLGSLWMAYQPIVSWSEQRIYGFEALLRSEEPKLPHPGVVLEAAERLGRLPELGQRVRARVASDMTAAPLLLKNVFINLHPSDLHDESLYGPANPLLPYASRVVLELTERASLTDQKEVTARVTSLRGLGFRIALDDLGAGYSGLASFAQLGAEVVKYDMALVRGVDQDERRRRLVQSMTALFRELGVLVIAEGVETEGERNALVSVGCDLLQGYLFAKPAKDIPTVRFR
jgi:EAL domain-containing protein (putative c-di-GMP-specific phosphodiesterase class I)